MGFTEGDYARMREDHPCCCCCIIGCVLITAPFMILWQCITACFRCLKPSSTPID